MEKKGTRIPREFYKFDPYTGQVKTWASSLLDDGITKRGIHVGMTELQITALNSHTAEWRSGDPEHPGAYEIHLINPKALGGTTPKIKEVQRSYIDFLDPILTVINVNTNMTNEDRDVLNLAYPDPVYTHPTIPIASQVFARVIPKGNFRLQVKGYTAADASRASLAAGADSMRIAYRKDPIELEIDPITHLPIPGKIKRNLIKSPQDGTTIISFTSATALWQVEGGATGDFLQFYVCWFNSKHPNLAGPWCGPYSESL
ncbi:MAG: hypothetical protein WCK16_05185 [Candidatus Moraniibacteriota bacterium]